MKFNHSMTKEQKAEYARLWRINRKSYVPQKCLAEYCINVEHRRGHCKLHYEILKDNCDKRMYNIWLNMRARCDNPKNPRYKDYGGRGIYYQSSWAHFINFYEDMSEYYSQTLTLDREDNNGNYVKGNCRWATRKVQNNNRRNNRLVTYRDITLNMTQWVERLEINKNAVYKRLSRGWSELQALGLESRYE